ncbi:glycosyltransferase family 2 protein [Kocuria sp. NPDC057446]|uniref:glycosyltransferase family 2 protein n=1 Tax=Kocuria sp. NPDC057446 TaxID=3346137 RepID=UPI0036B44682
MRVDVVTGTGGAGLRPGARSELRALLAELALRGVEARLVDPAPDPVPDPVDGPAGADPAEPGDASVGRVPEAEALLLVELAADAPGPAARLSAWLDRARAAAAAGRPVVVLGLALDPAAVPADAVGRLLPVASLVGLRDEASLAVARRLCPGHRGLRVGWEHALLLPPPTTPAAPSRPNGQGLEQDRAHSGPGEQQEPAAGQEPVEQQEEPPRIVAAVERPGGPFPPEQVAAVLAAVLDALVHRTAGEVTLVPCGGTSADEAFAEDVAARLRNDVRWALAAPGAAETVALRADWMLTTCSHGAALGLAARAVVLPVAPHRHAVDGIDSVLGRWGLGHGTVPLAALLTPGDAAWDTRAAVQRWATEAVEHRGAVRAALADAEPVVRDAAARWWEDVAGALRGRAPRSAPDAGAAPRGVGAPVVRALRRRYAVPEVLPERPTVAVVLRHRGNPDRLGCALDGLLAQTFTDWRLVVVDESGEPAGVEEPMSLRRAELAGRLTVLHHRRALGPAASANRGLRTGESEFVVLDDRVQAWPPTLLQRAVAHLEDPLVTDDGVVVRIEGPSTTGADVPARRPGRDPAPPDRETISLTDVLDGDRTAVDAPFLYRRAVHGVLGDYDETLGAAERWEFVLRFLETFTVGLLPGHPPAPQDRAGATAAARAEAAVRDRHLRQWSAEHGTGLPLYLRRAAADEAGALHRRLDTAEQLAHELLDVVRAQSRQIERLERVVAEKGFVAFWRRAWRSLRG